MYSADQSTVGTIKRPKNTVILVKPRPYPKDSAPDRSMPAYLPLSLLTIASPLLAAGYKVVVFDEKFDENIEEQITTMKDDVAIFGVTAQTGYEIIGGLRLSKYVKEVLGIPTVWGGWHASTAPIQTAENPNVDFVIKGQGMQTLLDLLAALEVGMDLSAVTGIVYKYEGKIRETPNRPLVDMNEYPPPSYDLVDMEKYIQEGCRCGIRITNGIHLQKSRFLMYSSSFGCPYRCGYCASNSVYGRKITMLSAEKVGEQLEQLVNKYDIHLVQFIDPNFFLDIRRVKDICREIISRNLRIQFSLGGPRVDQVMSWDDEVLPLLRESGCIFLGVGSESGSQDMLNYMNKDINAVDIIKAAKKIRAAGIDMTFFFMFGFPTEETSEDLMASLRLAAELKKLQADILLPMYFYDPYPGTPMYRDALEKGFKEPKSLEEWGHYNPEVTERKENVTYVTDDYVDMVKRVIIFYLPLAYPADMVLGTLTYVKSKMEAGKYKYLFRFLHHLARFRVENEFYSFPLEWMAFKALARLMPDRIYKR